MEIFENHTKDHEESHSCAPMMCSEEDRRAIIETEKQRKALFAQSHEGPQAEGRVDIGGSLAMALDNQFVKDLSMAPTTQSIANPRASTS